MTPALGVLVGALVGAVGAVVMLAPEAAPPRRDAKGARPPASPDVRATLSGTVRIGGTPGAARVELRPWPADGRLFADDPPLRATSADERGRFSFADVEPSDLEVRAVVPGAEAGRAFVAVRRADVSVPVDVLSGPETLRGRVVRDGGGRFRGVLLVRAADRVAPPSPRDADGGAVVAPDADGAFAVRSLPAGPYDVEAYHAPSGLRSRQRVEVPSGDAVVTLGDDVPSALGVRVVAEDGSPVAGAGVSVVPVGAARVFRPSASGTTGADGRFDVLVFAGASRAREVQVVAPGYVRVRLAWRPGDEEVRVVLSTGVAVTGRVVGPDGRGVGGVRVVAHAVGPRADARNDGVEAVSASDGVYRLAGLVAGDVRLVASGEGLASPVPDDGGAPGVAVALDAGPLGHADLAVEPTKAWRVRVRDARGAPVVDASVSVTPVAAATLAEPGDPRRPAVLTDGTGTAVVPDVLAARAWFVQALAPDRRSASRRFTAVPDDVVLELADARFVTVQLSDTTTGAPLAGRVRLVGPDGAPVRTGLSPAAWPLPPRGVSLVGPVGLGPAWLVGELDGWVPSDPVAVATDDATRIRLAPRLWIEGGWEPVPVQREAARPWVLVRRPDGSGAPTRVADRCFLSATSDRRPHFVEVLVEDGDTLWRGRSVAGPDVLVAVRPERVPPGVARVVLGSARPVAKGGRLVVWQRGADGTLRRDDAELDAFGGADVAVDPAAGPWWVDAAPALSDAFTVGPAVQGPFAPAQRVAAVPTWPRAWVEDVVARVEDERGAGVAGAWLLARLSTPSDTPGGDPYDEVETDGAGRAVVRLPQDALATVSVRVPEPFAPPDPAARVASGARAALAFRLVVGVTRAVTVRTPDGAPAFGARVALTWGSPDDVESDHADAIGVAPFTTGLDGRVDVPRLHPTRRCRLDVEPPAGSSLGRATATLDPGADAPTVVVLPPSR